MALLLKQFHTCIFFKWDFWYIPGKKKKWFICCFMQHFLKETSISMVVAFCLILFCCYLLFFFLTQFLGLYNKCVIKKKKNHSNSVITIASQVPTLCHCRLLVSFGLIVQDIWNWMHICYYSETYYLTLK